MHEDFPRGEEGKGAGQALDYTCQFGTAELKGWERSRSHRALCELVNLAA